MKILAIIALMFGLAGSTSANQHKATNEAAPLVSYIGFNTLKADHKKDRIAAFREYVKTIKPIMAEYGMTLDVYKVDAASDTHHPVDFITFGTAVDQQSFQAFFGDAKFQEAFPTLVHNIEAHFVTFVDRPVVPEQRHGGYTQLSLDWLKHSDDGAMGVFAALEHDVAAIGAHKGAQQTHRAAGVMASTGLTDDVAPAKAPTFVSLWHMEDPHAFLEDEKVSALNKKLAEHSETYRSFWISVADWDTRP